MNGEFGHFAALGAGFCIDGWGAGPFVIKAKGKQYRFGDSDRFGPFLANRHGDPIANPYPAERSPFWRAHRLWAKQGRRLAPDGAMCVWDEPPPNTWCQRGRARFLISFSDDDAAYVEVSDPSTIGTAEATHG